MYDFSKQGRIFGKVVIFIRDHERECNIFGRLSKKQIAASQNLTNLKNKIL